MRLFADEDFPLPTVLRLRELGHDVVTAFEAGIANDETPDDAILLLATQLDRALLTHNRRHFRRLHGLNPEHSGLILCKHDVEFARLADRIHDAIGTRAQLHRTILSIVRPNQPE